MSSRCALLHKSSSFCSFFGRAGPRVDRCEAFVAVLVQIVVSCHAIMLYVQHRRNHGKRDGNRSNDQSEKGCR